MFSIHPRGSFLDERISRSYAKEVLLANWQERRELCEEKSDCILPGMKRVDKCEEHITEIKYNYIPPWDIDESADATRHFLSGRNEALANEKRFKETQVRFPVTADMKKNYTTTYTIMYDIEPKESGYTAHGKSKDVNMMESYGNRTVTGTRCQKRAEYKLINSQKLETSYAAEHNLAKISYSS